jgi:hypothetical protein
MRDDESDEGRMKTAYRVLDPNDGFFECCLVKRADRLVRVGAGSVLEVAARERGTNQSVDLINGERRARGSPDGGITSVDVGEGDRTSRATKILQILRRKGGNTKG